MLIYEKLYFFNENEENVEEDGYFVSILDQFQRTSNGLEAPNVEQQIDTYWVDNKFLIDFLANESYDHYHLVEVFKAVISDPECRRTIIQSIIEVPFSYVYGDVIGNSLEEQLASLRRVCGIARDNQMRCIATWKYPALTLSGELEVLSHYITIFIDAVQKVAVLIDSRGLDYARNFHASWRHAHEALSRLLECEFLFRTVSYNYFDNQLDIHGTEDQFCQSWSLVFLEEFLVPYFSHSRQRSDSTSTRASRKRNRSVIAFPEEQMTTKQHFNNNIKRFCMEEHIPETLDEATDTSCDSELPLKAFLTTQLANEAEERDEEAEEATATTINRNNHFSAVLYLWKRCLAHSKVRIYALLGYKVVFDFLLCVVL